MPFGDEKPLSEKCRRILKDGPDCGDKSGRMTFVMCEAKRARQEDGKDHSTALKLGWKKIKEKCKRPGPKSG